MKHFALFLTSYFILHTSSFSQQPYWQQQLHYTIDVQLNDKLNSLKGNLQLEYINNSPDTLSFIWFHLWPNGYKNENTALAKQLASDKKSKKSFKNNSRGYVDSLRFTVNGQPAALEPDPQNIDVVKLLLPNSLLPQGKINIATPFYVKLPSYISRSGYDAQQYIVCQWYPKPAVYDRKGWHAMPYLDQGEFYSEFGSFDVNITLPADYVVGATGALQTKDELEKYKSIGAQNYNAKANVAAYKTDMPASAKTLHYKAENVHDFAWFADKDFVVQYDTMLLASGNIIDVFSYAQPNGNKEWANSVSFIEDAVKSYSNWLGEYPYPVVAAVEGPKNLSSGGMEYPMITLITSPDANKETLDAVITHEVGHNWFYGILASNERDHPWMDEGLNTYFQFRYEAEKYRSNLFFGSSIPAELRQKPVDEFLARVMLALNTIPAKDPIATHSTGFSDKEAYGMVAYIKTAIWMSIVETSIGKENLEKGLKQYFNDWKFKHPYPEDLKASLEKGSGVKMDPFFELLNKEGNFQ